MNKNFINELHFVAEAKPLEETLRAMGYRTVNAKNTQRYHAALQPPYFGLHRSMFDMKYSSEEFLIKLCEVLGVRTEAVQRTIKQIKADLEAKRLAFKPYIWIDTLFERSDEPDFVLAAMEGHRHIELRDDLWRYPLALQLEEAQEVVRTHWHNTFGELPIWGVIDAYFFFYAEEEAYVLAPTGEVLGKYNAEDPYQTDTNPEIKSLLS